jgi:homoserine kinase type II
VSILFPIQLWNMDGPCRITRLDKGYMNGTYQIEYGDGAKFVGKMYECERENKPRIVREVGMAQQLSGCGLSFQVPEFVALPDRGGERIAKIAAGSGLDHYAVLMTRIEGQHPDLNDPSEQFESGRALAELDIVLSRIPVEPAADRNPSYSEPGRFHPLIDRVERLPELIPADITKLGRLATAIEDILDKLDKTVTGLPRQMIHGDYTNGNRLIRRGIICGVLDFEFHCCEARAMECAVAIGGGPSALWEHGDGWNILEAFAQGYFSLLALEEKEIEAMPTLIRLRRLVMLLCFTARYIQGYDRAEKLGWMLNWMLNAEQWLEGHGNRLTESLHRFNHDEREFMRPTGGAVSKTPRAGNWER